MDLYMSFPAIVRDLTALLFQILPLSLLLLAAPKNPPADVCVEGRETGAENHSSAPVIFAMLNTRKKCYYGHTIIQTHP